LVRRAGYVTRLVKIGIVYTIFVAKLKSNITDSSSTLLGKFFNCMKKKNTDFHSTENNSLYFSTCGNENHHFGYQGVSRRIILKWNEL